MDGFLDKTIFPDAEFQVFGQEMVQLLNQRASTLCADMAHRYANRPTPAAILQAVRPLRVLVFAFQGRPTRCTVPGDLADAFKVAGHQSNGLCPQNTRAFPYELIQTIHRFDPDVLLLNGRSRGDLTGLPENLCVLSWDQDYCLSNRKQLAADMRPR